MSNPDQDKPSFDEEWKRAFEDAEISPGSRVWAGIDVHLDGKARQKNRPWIWYTAAAASVLLFLTLGIGYWYGNEAGKNNNVALQNPVKSSPSVERSTPSAANPASNATVTSEARPPADSERKSPVSPIESPSPATDQGAIITSKQKHSVPSVAPDHQEKHSDSVLKESAIASNKKKNDAVVSTGNPNKPTTANLPDNQVNKTTKKIAGRLFVDRVPKKVGQRKNTEEIASVQNGTSSELTKRNKAKANNGFKNARVTKNALREAVAKRDDANYPDRKNSNIIGSELLEEKTPRATSLSFLLPNGIKNQPALPLALAEKRPIVYLPDALASIEPAASETRKKSPIWMNAVFAPTYFNPHMTAAYQQPASTSFTANNYLQTAKSNPPQRQPDVSKPNFSYTVGLNAGADLPGRWTLEGGVQYLYNRAELQTQAYLENTATKEKYPIIADFLAGNQGSAAFVEKAASNDYAPAISSSVAPTKLNNSSSTVSLGTQYQYIGIPVKLGYQLNRSDRLRLMASAGVSTDFLLKNTLTSSESDVNDIEIMPGGSSAYRSVNFSALLGLGFQYRYANHLFLVIEPTYRTSLHSITKINSVKTLPSNLGLSLGVKYHF